MKVYIVAMLSFLAASSSAARILYTEEQVIVYAKSIDVGTLDPSLPSERLEHWLKSGPPHVHIYSWLVADTCNLKPVSPNEDYPLCARIAFGRNGVKGFFLVQVGTTGKGIVGPPQLYGGIDFVEMKRTWL